MGIRSLYLISLPFLGLMGDINAQTHGHEDIEPLSIRDLGVHGHIYEIHEDDMLAWLQAKMAQPSIQNKVEDYRRKIQNQAQARVNRPNPVEGLQEVREAKTHYYDPTVVAAETISDDQGNIVVKKGQRANPLHGLNLSSSLLIFDGDNPKHLAWACQKPASAKWVLVKGAPLELMRRYQRVVFFDQKGIITAKFGLTHIPCCISQEGDVLRIDEEKIDKEG